MRRFLMSAALSVALATSAAAAIPSPGMWKGGEGGFSMVPHESMAHAANDMAVTMLTAPWFLDFYATLTPEAQLGVAGAISYVAYDLQNLQEIHIGQSTMVGSAKRGFTVETVRIGNEFTDNDFARAGIDPDALMVEGAEACHYIYVEVEGARKDGTNGSLSAAYVACYMGTTVTHESAEAPVYWLRPLSGEAKSVY